MVAIAVSVAVTVFRWVQTFIDFFSGDRYKKCYKAGAHATEEKSTKSLAMSHKMFWVKSPNFISEKN